MTIDEMIEVLQAYKEGKKIEMFVKTRGEWVEVKKPLWNFFDCVYRVKKNPTRLDVANEIFEKTFGIKNKFTKRSCIGNSYIECAECEAYKEGLCKIEKWWNEEFIGGEYVQQMETLSAK